MLNFGPASTPGEPLVPVAAQDSSARYPYLHNGVSLALQPVLSFPTPVVKNVMFYVDRDMGTNKEITERYPLESHYQPEGCSFMAPYMRDAILTHYEPVITAPGKNIYRFYYVVPPELQHIYNIDEHKKDTDGYTLEDTARTNEMFYRDYKRTETQRIWHEPVPASAGELVPYNIATSTLPFIKFEGFPNAVVNNITTNENSQSEPGKVSIQISFKIKGMESTDAPRSASVSTRFSNEEFFGVDFKMPSILVTEAPVEMTPEVPGVKTLCPPGGEGQGSLSNPTLSALKGTDLYPEEDPFVYAGYSSDNHYEFHVNLLPKPNPGAQKTFNCPTILIPGRTFPQGTYSSTTLKNIQLIIAPNAAESSVAVLDPDYSFEFTVKLANGTVNKYSIDFINGYPEQIYMVPTAADYSVSVYYQLNASYYQFVGYQEAKAEKPSAKFSYAPFAQDFFYNGERYRIEWDKFPVQMSCKVGTAEYGQGLYTAFYVYKYEGYRPYQPGYWEEKEVEVGENKKIDGKFKTFHQITRTFVYRLKEYVPLKMGTFDPSNQVSGIYPPSFNPENKLEDQTGYEYTPDFAEHHESTGYDAQLVHEERIPFEEDYMNKVFVRVRRVYMTVPGPVVKELVAYSSYRLGDTVWASGGPGQAHPWVAQVAQRWSREVWAFPDCQPDQAGQDPRVAQVPVMPQEALKASPVTKGWDKGSFPALQRYTISSMYKTNNNLTLQDTKESLSADCCNPPSSFIRCLKTTVYNNEMLDWTNGTDLPPLTPPDPSEGCSKWQVVSSVTVKEGHSVLEQRKTCTTVDYVNEYWESRMDEKTGFVVPVIRKLVDEPTSTFIDPVTGALTDGWKKSTDQFGNEIYIQEEPQPGWIKTRQYSTPCHAVDTITPKPGLGYYKRYTTAVQFSFPPVIVGNSVWSVRRQPNMSGRVSDESFMYWAKKDGYSGYCSAVVEEVFSPDATLPAGWSLGVSPQFVTNSGSFSSPLLSASLPAALHSGITFIANVGNRDAIWSQSSFSYVWSATSRTNWSAVTFTQVQPYGTGVILKKTTISPPA